MALKAPFGKGRLDLEAETPEIVLRSKESERIHQVGLVRVLFSFEKSQESWTPGLTLTWGVRQWWVWMKSILLLKTNPAWPTNAGSLPIFGANGYLWSFTACVRECPR